MLGPVTPLPQERWFARCPVAAALILLLCATPAHATEPTPALPAGLPQQIADVASYGTLGAELALEVIDAIKAKDGGHAIERVLLGVSLAWAGSGILKTATHRARPCAPACGIDSPDTSFPSAHAWYAGQGVWGAHKGWKAGLAITTATLRPLANKHHPTDVLAGFGFGFGSTLVW